MDRRPVAQAETSRTPAIEPRGVCLVSLDVPADATSCLTVIATPEDPGPAFLARGEPLLAERGDWQVAEWRPDPTAPGWDPDAPPATIEGGRARVELRLEDLPLGVPLWIALPSRDEDGVPLASAPGLVRLDPLESSSAPAHVALSFAPLGAVALRVGRERSAEDAAPDPSSAGELDGEEAEDDPSDEEEPEDPAPRVDQVELRRRGGAEGDENGRERSLVLWPLAAGPYELDSLARGEGFLHRREWSARVRDGETLDLGTWRLVSGFPALSLEAVDEGGAPLLGAFELELRGWAPVWVGADEHGSARLFGDWSELREVRFAPREQDAFEPASLPVAPDADHARLVCRRRERRLGRVLFEAVFPDGTVQGQPAWAVVRDDATKRWEPFGWGWSAGCTSTFSSALAPGPHEIAAWMPDRGLSFVGAIDMPEVEADRVSPDAPSLRVRFEDPATLVRGRLRVTCAGVPVLGSVELWPVPRGGRVGSFRPWWPRPLDPFDSGPFELCGLPPGVDLDLVARDAYEDEGPELCRVPLRLARGETLDLGQLSVELRRPGAGER